MKSFVALLAGLFFTSSVLAQDTPPAGAQTNPSKSKLSKETFQPDVKGDLLFAVGLNAFSNAPEVASLSNWGSKSVNLYYLYDFNLGNTGFSFHPGFGLAFEKYAWENPVNLQQNIDATGSGGAPAIELVPVTEIVAIPDGSDYELRKSKLAATYLDVPLEFSYAFKKDNPRAGFKIVVGGRAGLLLGNHTKVKYRVSDDTRKYKLAQDYNLNPFRYSAHTRVGYGGFNLYFEYQLSEVFDAGDEPTINIGNNNAGDGVVLEGINNWRVGLAIDLF
jgi:hypothetical protein